MFDTRNKVLRFSPKGVHMVALYAGERYSISAYMENLPKKTFSYCRIWGVLYIRMHHVHLAKRPMSGTQIYLSTLFSND